MCCVQLLCGSCSRAHAGLQGEVHYLSAPSSCMPLICIIAVSSSSIASSLCQHHCLLRHDPRLRSDLLLDWVPLVVFSYSSASSHTAAGLALHRGCALHIPRIICAKLRCTCDNTVSKSEAFYARRSSIHFCIGHNPVAAMPWLLTHDILLPVPISLWDEAAKLRDPFFVAQTSWITMTSARSMFIAQAGGNAIGCLVAPAIFWWVPHTVYETSLVNCHSIEQMETISIRKLLEHN